MCNNLECLPIDSHCCPRVACCSKKFLVLFSLNFAINFFYLIFCLILRNERLKLKHMQCKLKGNHLNFVSDVVVFVIRVLVCSVQWNLY